MNYQFNEIKHFQEQFYKIFNLWPIKEQLEDEVKYRIIENNVQIGVNTRIWHFSHIAFNARIGRDCNIGNNVFIGRNVIIGDNVRIANGVNIYEGAIIKNNVFIGNNVSFTNVKYPYAWRKANEYLATVIEDNATINANAVIRAGIRIGKNALIGEGAIVIHDVSDDGFVVSPAAQCICNNEKCYECSNRKKKKLIKHLKYVKRHQKPTS